MVNTERVFLSTLIYLLVRTAFEFGNYENSKPPETIRDQPKPFATTRKLPKTIQKSLEVIQNQQKMLVTNPKLAKSDYN